VKLLLVVVDDGRARAAVDALVAGVWTDVNGRYPWQDEVDPRLAGRQFWLLDARVRGC
jgi:hypothetical protein